MFTRLILPILAAVVLGFSVISILRNQPARASAEPPLPPPSSQFKTRVAAVGLIEASSENISIGSHLPGIAAEMLVKVGDRIKVGTPLFRLDTRHLQAQLAEAKGQVLSREAAVLTAQAQVTTAKSSQNEASINLGNAESMKDGRGLSVEEMTRRRTALDSANANITAAEAAVAAARADVTAAAATVDVVTTDLARSTVTAPIDATVLQVKLRPGEAVSAGPVTQPYLLLGNISPLHIRVDVDEHEAWRVQPNTAAEASVRGNAALRASLRFVRFEPYVIPKASLTGAATERVDTRVLQIIYELDSPSLRLFPGQQMDVFIQTDS
jgi:multidrug efflux pump subunit AcrA (membrane-fusion protein)